jgi:hypothetical protein
MTENNRKTAYDIATEGLVEIYGETIKDGTKLVFNELQVQPASIDPGGKHPPRMLFLDDRTKRIEAALKQYAGKYDLTIVTNTKECLRYLCRREFDIVSLDHDLNGDDFQNPDDVTSGMEVVRYIARCGGFPPSQIVVPEVWIHSSNLFAANLMITELLKVGIPAYFRKFEYDDDEKSFWDGTRAEKKEPVEDKWDYSCDVKCYTRIGKCEICLLEKIVNYKHICHDCYKRELIQCA